MLTSLVLTVAFIFTVTIGGILVERLYRRFARSHPELGPFRKAGKQDCCSCSTKEACNGSSCHD